MVDVLLSNRRPFQCEDMYVLLLCHVMDVGQVCTSSAIAYYVKRQSSRHKIQCVWPTFCLQKSSSYILNNISFILYSFLAYLYCRKNIMVLPKGSQKHIYHQDAEFLIAKILCLVDVFCNHLFCRKVVFLTAPHCQFRRVVQDMTQTYLDLWYPLFQTQWNRCQ
jgi:hypothetical protein